MRIAYITACLGYGGAEQLIVDLSRVMSARGHTVLVVSMLNDTPHAEKLARIGVQVLTLDMQRGIPDLRAIFRLVRILRPWHPDVIHAHGFPANILSRVARLFVRSSVLVCTAHAFREEGRGAQWLYPLTDHLCTITTNVSQAAVDNYIRLKRVPRDRILFVPNGVDTSFFKPDSVVREETRRNLGIADKTFLWIAVGRLIEIKAYDNLISAVALLPPSQRPQMCIVGEGHLEQVLKEQAARSGLSEHIHFLGRRTDVNRLMNAADGYVMSSDGEGMPMVLLEAAASALPIVATDVGGNKEVLLHDRTGFIVPPRDSQAMADAMLKLQAMAPDLRLAMGQAGRTYICATYELSQIVLRWEQLYQQWHALTQQKPLEGHTATTENKTINL